MHLQSYNLLGNRYLILASAYNNDNMIDALLSKIIQYPAYANISYNDFFIHDYKLLISELVWLELKEEDKIWAVAFCDGFNSALDCV